jgi:hypothetical protein
MSLSLDGTEVRFQADIVNYPCSTKFEPVRVGAAAATANASTSPYLHIDNSALHDWYLGNGVLGQSYCWDGRDYDCAYMTTFQRLIYNASGVSASADYLLQDARTLLFGLDLRTEDSGDDKYVAPTTYGNGGSAMQLGGFDAQFADRLVWVQQATQDPDYHQFILNDLQFCGAQILGNYSTDWNVLVDTGSVCLTLPSDIYDSFDAWQGLNSTVIEDVNALPAFSFQVGDGANSTTLYVPLGDLLVNETAIDVEQGAPYVRVRDADGSVQQMRLCVLKGESIAYSSAGQSTYYTDAPDIVLGALALQSIYFAADFAQQTVGLANKLSNSYINGFSAAKRVGCAPAATCKGDQTFRYATNDCTDPTCARYFFAVLDTDTMTCEPNYDNMVGGLIFIIILALAETVAYFVMQYSAYASLEAGRGMPIDPITKFVGAKLSVVVDLIVVYLLNWAPRPRPVRIVAGTGNRRGDFHND